MGNNTNKVPLQNAGARMYNKIYNPNSRRMVNVQGKLGRQILQSYINTLQMGGADISFTGGAVIFDTVKKCLGCETEEEKEERLSREVLDREQDESHWPNTNVAPNWQMGNFRPSLKDFGYNKEQYDDAIRSYNAVNANIAWHKNVSGRTRDGLRRLGLREPATEDAMRQEMDRN